MAVRRSEIEFTGLGFHSAMRKVRRQVLIGVLLGRRGNLQCLFTSLGYHSARRILMQRRKHVLSGLLAGVVALSSMGSIAAQSKSEAGGTPALQMPKVGEMAPDFTLNYFDGKDLKAISLSQYRGKKNVVVAFFIFAFTGG
jgi:hypothetical protein